MFSQTLVFWICGTCFHRLDVFFYHSALRVRALQGSSFIHVLKLQDGRSWPWGPEILTPSNQLSDL